MKSLLETQLEAHNAFLTNELETLQAQLRATVTKYESALANAQALLDGKDREVLNLCEKIVLLTEKAATFQALWFHAAAQHTRPVPPAEITSN